MYVHAYTLFGALRCFGCSLMLAACGPKGPELCCIDPSGTYQDSYGCAVGKHRGAAKTEIEKLDLKNMDGRSLVKEAARILFMLRDGKEFDMELSWVGRNTKGKHLNVPKLLFDESKRYAVAEEQQRDSEED
ncbi:proteasome subunit alpha type-3 [Caerostris extrusa]|uniref:Proteasome subunit alpha type-3 n=1 Tax=Caerostris extrusa TaxID=172846 RepID=A0AAV4MSQ9_CAEEX|nr:proteasome subunit alpha type-3 [Caerostris extrusa]